MRIAAGVVTALPLVLLYRFPGTMGWTLGFAVYFIVWWTLLFAVLPFGVRTQGESGEVIPGTPESAPAAPRLNWIFTVTTVVASAAFTLVWLALHYRLVPLDFTTG